MRAALCALLLAFTMACGGDDGGSTSPPPPGGGGSNQDVCAAARSEAIEPERTAALALRSSKRGRLDPSPRWRVLDSLWIHQQAADRRAAISSLGPREATTSDIGDIAVIRDEGDLIAPANASTSRASAFASPATSPWRLRRSRERLGVQNRHRHPDHAHDERPASADVGFSSIFLGDRAHRVRELRRQHHLPRRGQRQHRPHVGRPDPGPPGLAAFLADLDPSDRRPPSSSTPPATSTPSPGAGRSAVDSTRPRPPRRHCCRTDDRDAIRRRITLPMPSSASAGRPSISGPRFECAGTTPERHRRGERFSENPDLDVVSVRRRSIETIPSVRSTVIWTDPPWCRGTLRVRVDGGHEVQGIGLEVFDTSREFGAPAAAELHVVDASEVSRRPDHTLSGREHHAQRARQEVGHRWVRTVNFRDHLGQRSEELLGRDQAHWSFSWTPTRR